MCGSQCHAVMPQCSLSLASAALHVPLVTMTFAKAKQLDSSRLAIDICSFCLNSQAALDACSVFNLLSPLVCEESTPRRGLNYTEHRPRQFQAHRCSKAHRKWELSAARQKRSQKKSQRRFASKSMQFCNRLAKTCAFHVMAAQHLSQPAL